MKKLMILTLIISSLNLWAQEAEKIAAMQAFMDSPQIRYECIQLSKNFNSVAVNASLISGGCGFAGCDYTFYVIKEFQSIQMVNQQFRSVGALVTVSSNKETQVRLAKVEPFERYHPILLPETAKACGKLKSNTDSYLSICLHNDEDGLYLAFVASDSEKIRVTRTQAIPSISARSIMAYYGTEYKDNIKLEWKLVISTATTDPDQFSYGSLSLNGKLYMPNVYNSGKFIMTEK